MFAVAFAIAQHQVVAGTCDSDIKEAGFAALVGRFAFTAGRYHSHRRGRGIGMRLQGKIALDQAGQVDNGKFQSLAGVDGHDADDIRLLLAIFFSSLPPVITTILT